MEKAVETAQQYVDAVSGMMSDLAQHSISTTKNETKEIVFFIEDDYLHFSPMMEEMIASYERISSQIKKSMFASIYEFLLFELMISKGKITKFLYP